MISALAATAAAAQGAGTGFAELGARDAEFAKVTPGRAFSFPEDHGAHEGYRTEWWYVTANLTDEAGTALGVQWTLFRSAFEPRGEGEAPPAPWSAPFMWMGHAAVTTAETHLADERFARGAVGHAGVSAAPFRAFIDDWRFEATGADGLDAARVTARTDEFSYELTLTADGPVVLQGEQGYSVKTYDGHASYYYSQPFFRVAGVVEIDGAPRRVTGRAWMDREWSSRLLGEAQTGWDWFSLHLDNGEKVAVARVRDQSGDDYRAGVWIAADGAPTPLGPDDVELIERGRKRVGGVGGRGVRAPVRWRVKARDPSGARPPLDVETRALNERSWMATSFPYWEGPIRVSGSHAGVGYLEMTGY
ncbi:MAG: lipocalin-like domain-containing protein [Parvularculaceae bacterium]